MRQQLYEKALWQLFPAHFDGTRLEESIFPECLLCASPSTSILMSLSHPNKSASVSIHYFHFTFKEIKLRDAAKAIIAVVELTIKSCLHPVYTFDEGSMSKSMNVR